MLKSDNGAQNGSKDENERKMENNLIESFAWLFDEIGWTAQYTRTLYYIEFKKKKKKNLENGFSLHKIIIISTTALNKIPMMMMMIV